MIQAPVSQGSGSWLEYLRFDDEVLWKITDTYESWAEVSGEPLLPSNSSKRIDRIPLAKKDYANTQKEKEKIEARDQEDVRLRKAWSKKKK